MEQSATTGQREQDKIRVRRERVRWIDAEGSQRLLRPNPKGREAYAPCWQKAAARAHGFTRQRHPRRQHRQDQRPGPPAAPHHARTHAAVLHRLIPIGTGHNAKLKLRTSHRRGRISWPHRSAAIHSYCKT